ncbi:MAG: cytidylate kinase-like family protein [Anaerotruncus sp.]|nr:cytidylate kinase-like family protein [Anaerotruncus sp.]
MQNYVITIARGYGSGGKTIGKQLAQELKIPYYDKELLRRASDESGINEALFAQTDEQLKKRPMLFKPSKRAYTGEVISPESSDFTSEQNLFNYQAKVIKDIAQTETCVIVGRCADFVLKDMPHVLRLFIHAPFDYCVEKTMERHIGMSKDEAIRFIRKTDKRRGEYYRYFTGHDWQDANNYDLCINSSQLGWDKCIALVRSYLEIKLGHPV